MPTNKNALIRYKILDKCFRNPGKRYFIEDLINECEKFLLEIDANSNGISRRQILQDITFMESGEGWSIELARLSDGRRKYYRYADLSFSINNMPLNEVEIEYLRSAAQILGQFRGMPQFEWLSEIIERLRQDTKEKNVNETIIEFDSNQYLKGIEYLGTLHNAIFYKKVLNIAYQPFGIEKPAKIELHPYFLKQYHSRWFLFGFNPENGKFTWNLAIDRIGSIEELAKEYKQNTEIDWGEYFEDIVGVTKPIDGKLEEIVLHFNKRTGRYMESKPIHGSQKSSWITPDVLEIKLKLIVNYEFERLILSYADAVQVKHPDAFADIVADRLKAAASKYHK